MDLYLYILTLFFYKKFPKILCHLQVASLLAIVKLHNQLFFFNDKVKIVGEYIIKNVAMSMSFKAVVFHRTILLILTFSLKE